MLAFQIHNQIAHLRQFAFALMALIVWSANDSVRVGFPWAMLLVSYPLLVHWALRRFKATADNPDRAFVLDALIVSLTLLLNLWG